MIHIYVQKAENWIHWVYLQRTMCTHKFSVRTRHNIPQLCHTWGIFRLWWCHEPLGCDGACSLCHWMSADRCNTCVSGTRCDSVSDDTTELLQTGNIDHISCTQKALDRCVCGLFSDEDLDFVGPGIPCHSYCTCRPYFFRYFLQHRWVLSLRRHRWVLSLRRHPWVLSLKRHRWVLHE